MRRFGLYEVHPCVRLGSNGQVISSDAPPDVFEQCAENDPNIAVWAVYGHHAGQGLTWLADCLDRETAEAFRASLESNKEGER